MSYEKRPEHRLGWNWSPDEGVWVRGEDPVRTVTLTRVPTRHGLHLLLSVLTLGAWVPVWAVLTVWHKIGPRARAVTRSR
jgi:hypothetical protein